MKAKNPFPNWKELNRLDRKKNFVHFLIVRRWTLSLAFLYTYPATQMLSFPLKLAHYVHDR